MIIISRKTTLNWVVSETAFEAINKASLVALTRPLGTSVNAVNRILSRAEEMEMLLPDVLGVSPTSTSWQTVLTNYWHNFGLDVPPMGTTFNISLEVDVTDYRRTVQIAELLKELSIGKSKTDDLTSAQKEQALVDFITSDKCPEELVYRYAHPVNVADYLSWRYCLLSSLVANEPEMVELSTRIKFYLLDDAKLIERKAKIAKVKSKAIKMYSALISSKDSKTQIDNLIIGNNSVSTLGDFKKLDSDEKEGLLMDIATTNPEKFITLLEDKTIAETAEIRKFEMASLIRKLTNTTIYVDASDATVILGNTMSEVISYMAASVNAAYVNELRTKFKALNI